MDSVDQIAVEWAEELPHLPVAPIQIITRIGRLRARFDHELGGLFARYDLTAGDFTVIAALRRSGSPYELPQSVLMQRLGLTSGTVSVRINRLAAKGVVSRTSHPSDARGSMVRLTQMGEQLFRQVAPAHLSNEDLLLSALSDDERHALTQLLRKLLISFEHERSVSPLGFVVAPAQAARRAQGALGLSDTAGLLVVDLLPGSPAANAGLRTGDVLVAAGGEPLRSCLTLADQTKSAAGTGLDLTALRKNRRITLRVPVP